jgi:hypothetical protein
MASVILCCLGVSIFTQSQSLSKTYLAPIEKNTAQASLIATNVSERVLSSAEDTSLISNNYTSYRDHVGSWVADTWIPPIGWRLYTVTELQSQYHGKRILWLGDSTNRRAAATFYAMLNASKDKSDNILLQEVDHTSVIDVNKGRVTEVCQKWVNTTFETGLCRSLPGGGELLVVTEACVVGLRKMIIKELDGTTKITENVDVLVISLGIWEVMQQWLCLHPIHGRDTIAVLNETITAVEQLLDKNTGVTVLWRTSGFDGRAKKVEEIKEQNRYIMDRIDTYSESKYQHGLASRFLYVHWGGAIEPRSFNETRIAGDIHPHYGFQARFVLAQMITNRLAQQYQDEIF